jgi:hypothetical protein
MDNRTQQLPNGSFLIPPELMEEVCRFAENGTYFQKEVKIFYKRKKPFNDMPDYLEVEK